MLSLRPQASFASSAASAPRSAASAPRFASAFISSTSSFNFSSKVVTSAADSRISTRS